RRRLSLQSESATCLHFSVPGITVPLRAKLKFYRSAVHMNYRHEFHAGNFADVLKHAVLVRILVHLRAKPAAFRVIDTHAGSGIYDLAAPEAQRSLEWRDGIGRLVKAPLTEEVRALVAPYLDAVAARNPSGRLGVYPGSPALVQAFLRAQDRL